MRAPPIASAPVTSAALFLLGDSHGRILAQVAAERGQPLAGGFIASGRQLNAADFYAAGDGDVRFHDPKIEATYRGVLATTEARRLSEIALPVLCLFGMNLHYLTRREVWGDFSLSPHAPGRFLSTATVRATLRAQMAGALAFHRHLASLGLTVISALPPRRFAPPPTETCPEVFLAFEDLAREEIAATGTQVIDHRSWSLDPDGRLRPEFAAPDDAVHGSPAFAGRLLDDLFAAARAT
ncbi:hypothetical protein GCM10007301_44910 [Azorhizobium oxalatiphilum]|uniref:Uncharacterized protein n=1 Tax=Azorhizobium oxalatiphilum TaxID=980631 RepID=A0A917CAQ0_9HYPH|nr:hypothetical protein [Azorhizobium oxalatiphilum]GGF79829.1 hypothetical protein GCM10007301_44910 [Azorhizobium oxalatiphilum]